VTGSSRRAAAKIAEPKICALRDDMSCLPRVNALHNLERDRPNFLQANFWPNPG
jgi:hypothetical protein